MASILAILVLAACTAAGSSTPIIPATLTAPLPTLSATRRPPTPTQTATPPPTRTQTPIPQVTLVAVGDIMLGRTGGDQVLAKGAPVVFDGVN